MTQEFTKISIDANNALVSGKEQLPALGDNDVRVQVLFSNLNQFDLNLWEGKKKEDCFGSEVVGKVIGVGKAVGHCKLEQIVGVYRDRKDSGSGFVNFIQAHQDNILYIPDSIEPQQAAIFLGQGATAFNAIEKVESGSAIAVVGSGHLAYLVTQFAKKLAGCTVTVFSYEGNEETAKGMGADAFVVLSKGSIAKHDQKFKAVVITDFVKEEEAFCIQDMAWRSHFIIYATTMGYTPKVGCLEFMTGQKTYLGASRGTYGQVVKAVKAAAYHNVRGKVEVFEAEKFQAAFEKAKSSKSAQSIALKY